MIGLPFCGAAAFAVLLAAQSADAPGDPLIAGFKSSYPASVSDAVGKPQDAIRFGDER